MLFIGSVSLMNNKEVHHLPPLTTNTATRLQLWYQTLLLCLDHFLINTHVSPTVIEYSFLSGPAGAGPRLECGMHRAGVVS